MLAIKPGKRQELVSKLLPIVCHLDRPRGTLSLAKGTECEWRDPENECATRLIQGILPELCPSKPRSPECRHEQLGENTSDRYGRGRILGISPLALSRFAPSWSVEMTDVGSSGEPSILTPVLFASFWSDDFGVKND